MEEESERKINPENPHSHQDEQRNEEPSAKPSSDQRTDARKRLRWPVWLLVILIVLLFASSIANLVVSQRAYESSQKQVKAIEQLTQSIKAVQRSIFELSRMIEQSPPEDEEPEEDWRSEGDGSI
jgi:Tfp pilus assembly protein PilN